MSYLTRNHMIDAIATMQGFYRNLSSVYKDYGMDIESNRGRRNILMSAPMEKFIAKELEKTCGWAHSDGRTGKADIEIGLDANTKEVKELECKLTSPHSNGSIVFQTDFETLQKKGSMDFIYLIANEDFSGFCAVFFQGLTTEDFRPLSPGARGKVQMYKHKGMEKATVLIGNAVSHKQKRIENLQSSIDEVTTRASERLKHWDNKISKLTDFQIYDRNTFEDKKERAISLMKNQIKNINNKIEAVSGRKDRYSFEFEEI